MIIAPAILVLLAVHPQQPPSAPGKIEFGTWKPGPQVSQEIKRIDRELQTLVKGYRDEKVTHLKVIQELARGKTQVEMLRAVSFRSHSDEVPELLVVILELGELWTVFPLGFEHLPAKLVPGSTYPVAPDDERKVEFLGERRVTGMRVAAFRSITHTPAGQEPQN